MNASAQVPLRAERLLWYAAVAVVVALFAIRLLYLTADFTTDRQYSRDGVLYSDEGWYANNALALYRVGTWYRPGELNFAVNLPVLQWMHAASFAVFGPTILGARVTVVVAYFLTAALLFAWLRAACGRWCALAAVAFLGWNHFLFLHSRFALGELPMTLLATAALALAWHAGKERSASRFVPPPGALSALAGIVWGLAFLTKNSALFAAPLLAGIVAWRCLPDYRTAALRLALLAAGAGLVLLAHYLLIARPHWEDYRYFLTLNVGANAKSNISEVARYAAHMLDHLRLVDKVLYRALALAVPALLVLSPRFRREPLLWLALAWFALYLGMFSFYVNLRPRYWQPLGMPAAMLVALVLRELWLLREGFPRAATVATALFGAALLGSAARSLSETAKYLSKPKYSFATMAKDVERRVTADPQSRNILLGHFSSTVALHTKLIPVNDRFAPTPLEARLEEYRPRWLLTESTTEERDYADQYRTITAAEGGLRTKALRRYYEEPELVAQYDVFDNYNGWPISLYRLTPKAK